MTQEIIGSVRRQLKNNTDVKTKQNFHRFFKEDIKFYGVKIPLVEKIAISHYPKIRTLTKTETFAVSEELLKSGICEEAFIAFSFAYLRVSEFVPADFKILEKWIHLYVTNWATCDTLCNHTVGSFVDRYPQFIQSLKNWTKSDNRWVKRASAVTLILPARNGKYLEDVFEIADSLLTDTDDLVQKGYGWLLKEASRKHQEEVFAYVMKHKSAMPRTALRYAIEKMPDDLRKTAMAKN
jgi:3-methyladenine DNA glycosylase AlkD